MFLSVYTLQQHRESDIVHPSLFVSNEVRLNDNNDRRERASDREGAREKKELERKKKKRREQKHLVCFEDNVAIPAIIPVRLNVFRGPTVGEKRLKISS